jgi:DNA-binding NtrC family response regulator
MITHRTGTWAEEIPPIHVIDSRDAIRRIERDALEAARWQTNVLITGARGAGKALLARFIHDRSDRGTRGFATIKCEGLPDLLFESALFGHVQGSFPGAYRDKPGLLESVPGGTVYLDEVAALSIRAQVRLLRFLETGKSFPIGGNTIQPRPWLNVRVIASTSDDLQARVAAGLFVNDLYLRLNVHHLSMPLLREQRNELLHVN